MDFADPMTTMPEPALEMARAPAHITSVGIVGGGLAGLACAARLAHKGLAVTVYERNEELGGKMNRRRREGYTWDTGPSLLTMPAVLDELWRYIGADLADDVELQRLGSTCLYRWADGTVIEEDEAFWARPEIAAFLKHAAGMYELSADTFLLHPLDEWLSAVTPRTLAGLRHLPKVASSKTLSELIAKFTEEPHLVQILERYATYNGSSPYKTPAAFAIIPWVEAHFGGWSVRGGLYTIVESLGRRVENLGGVIRTGTEVVAMQQTGGGAQTCLELTLQTGEEPPHTVRHDYVVCNEDVLSAYQDILAPNLREGLPCPDPPAHDLSLSGLVMLLEVERTYPELQHHNIFFSSDYHREFADLFEHHRPPEEPTIYVTVSARSEPSQAPPGCENWFVLVNAPNLQQSTFNWAKEGEAYADRVLDRLENQLGFEGLSRAIGYRELITPLDFQRRYRAFGGGIYGFASHSRFAAFQRPPMVAPGCDRLYFAGGTTHPGGGIPLVLLSGKMVAKKILRREHLG